MIYGFNDKKETINLLDYFYPVGSVYETADANFNPNSRFGGTWVKISGKFLLASGNGYSSGTTGGAASVSYTPAGSVGGHTLTVNEIPSHTHKALQSNGTTSIIGGESGISVDLANEATLTASEGAGGGQSHNHGFTGTAATIATMPPYEVVNVWKRTA